MERAARTTTLRREVPKARQRRRPAGGWLKPAIHAGIGLAAVGLIAWGVVNAVGTRDDRVAPAGKSDDLTPVTLLIAGERLTIPANMIRFPAARSGGAVESVDLLLHWPGLDGYSEDRADTFRDGAALAPLIYVTIAPRDNPLDSDGRLKGVYERFFTGAAIAGPAGLVGRRMAEDSGYRGEEIYHAPPGGRRFAARCVADATDDVPATCIRDVNIGAGLSMLYRFNRRHLDGWPAMDAGLKRLAASFLAAR